MGDLARGHAQPTHLAEERAGVVVGVVHLLPGRHRRGGTLVEPSPAGVGKHVGAPVAELLGADEALVLELRKGRVDRARARPPDSVRTPLDLLHDLVAVERPLREQQQRCLTDIAAAGPWATRKTARATEE